MNNIQLLPSYEVNIESCLPEKIQLRTRTEKKMYNILPVVSGCRPGDNLLSPSTLYIFGLFTGLSPLSANFHQNIQIV